MMASRATGTSTWWPTFLSAPLGTHMDTRRVLDNGHAPPEMQRVSEFYLWPVPLSSLLLLSALTLAFFGCFSFIFGPPTRSGLFTRRDRNGRPMSDSVTECCTAVGLLAGSKKSERALLNDCNFFLLDCCLPFFFLF